MGDDDALLDVVTSANVACGFHAGDAATMVRVSAEAARRGVRVGAHVSWRDLEGFGRRELHIDPAQVRVEVISQLGSLRALARTVGAEITYVKAHGALYNRCFHDDAMADALVDAVASFDAALVLLGQPGAVVLRSAARAGVRVATEGFADRAYLPSGQLMPRSQPGAVLDEDAAVWQALQLATGHKVATVDGEVELRVQSLCVHGDNPGAVALARRIRAELLAAGVALRPFT